MTVMSMPSVMVINHHRIFYIPARMMLQSRCGIDVAWAMLEQPESFWVIEKV